MLAGRARRAEMFPLCSAEIPDFSLEKVLRYGMLPQVYKSEEPEEELSAYVHTYLKEEIQEEALVRKLPQFSRFLKVSALSNAEQVNYTKIGNDAQIPPSTVKEYYQILKDTLVGFELPAWKDGSKRKVYSSPKFYFFDIGVSNQLAGIKTIDRNSNLYGKSFEHFIAMELRVFLSYRRISEELTYWKSTSNLEVDFVIGSSTAIEVKASRKISNRDLKGLRALKEENNFKNYFLLSQDKVPKKIDDTSCLYWKDFLEKLWANELNIV